MDWLILGLLLGAGLISFLVAVIAIARAGSLSRAFWGLTIAGRAREDAAFEAEIKRLLGESPAAAPVASSPSDKAATSAESLRLLALLQSEARLIDFLMEDIHSVSDNAQIGLAVREIHRKAQETLRQYLTLAPILSATEGESITIAVGFNPAEIRLLGQVTGQPPFTGSVQHPGWKVTEIRLPALPPGKHTLVLQPAEVVIG